MLIDNKNKIEYINPDTNYVTGGFVYIEVDKDVYINCWDIREATHYMRVKYVVPKPEVHIIQNATPVSSYDEVKEMLTSSVPWWPTSATGWPIRQVPNNPHKISEPRKIWFFQRIQNNKHRRAVLKRIRNPKKKIGSWAHALYSNSSYLNGPGWCNDWGNWK